MGQWSIGCVVAVSLGGCGLACGAGVAVRGLCGEGVAEKAGVRWKNGRIYSYTHA